MRPRRRVFPQLSRRQAAATGRIFYNASAFGEMLEVCSYKEALMGDRVKLTSMAKAAG
jgi:hypothetical protein